ncbi:hypothetical protein ABIE09_004051 [Lysobacter enzymogenes]|uniref:Uncharacterized protein n=1 Tax=Lysobacter enzymogenes TaxID=69 RepID=A0AAU9AKZ9_LYSEN|nr:hypothetical protein [Lysobacter enzymogenes]BAV95911.1 hypothetical protein LEN_0424 [Lysobacter enzymogenes]SDX92693.1 hypothetical protein SAMN05421681_10964 [Lysobacter enzymogenes]
MKPSYAKSAVEPVVVQKLQGDELSVRYSVFPESSYYSGGINYEKAGDTLKIVIDRCGISDKCAPMAKTVIPLDDKWQAEVRLPYHGEKVVLVHADQEEQIYP